MQAFVLKVMTLINIFVKKTSNLDYTQDTNL